jgi:hypothetical protein
MNTPPPTPPLFKKRGVDFLVSPACEDEEDIRDAIAELEDAKINGTLTWEQYKQELK